MKIRTSFWPKSLTSRISLVLLIGLGLSHAVSLSVYYFDRGAAVRIVGRSQLIERIVTIASLVVDASPEDQSKIIQYSNKPTLRVTLSKTNLVNKNDTLLSQRFLEAFKSQSGFAPKIQILVETGSPTNSVWRHFSNLSDAEHFLISEHFQHVMSDVNSGAIIKVSVKNGESDWINFEAPDFEAAMPWTIKFVLSITVMMITIAVLSAWAAHYLTSPLKQMANAAEHLGRRVTVAPIEEQGPSEVRQAIRIFNQMQKRINRFVDDRMQMIAAIAHDLRTPLMRMHLRSELLDDPDLQAKFTSDIEEMKQIVSATLSFSSEEAKTKQNIQIDLTALLENIAGDLTSIGRPISLDDSNSILVSGDPSSLRRALSNLLDNAARYGKRARVSLKVKGAYAIVCVDDEGPGIPEERIEDVFKPFFRIENSRNRETGGVGLGLSIARSVFRAHGGDIILQNANETGLHVEASLPL